MNPDVTFIHALKADRKGNILIEGIVGVQKEAVLAAAKHDGLPLEFASIALRADNEVVRAAVEQEKPGPMRFPFWPPSAWAPCGLENSCDAGRQPNMLPLTLVSRSRRKVGHKARP